MFIELLALIASSACGGYLLGTTRSGHIVLGGVLLITNAIVAYIRHGAV